MSKILKFPDRAKKSALTAGDEMWDTPCKAKPPTIPGADIRISRFALPSEDGTRRFRSVLNLSIYMDSAYAISVVRGSGLTTYVLEPGDVVTIHEISGMHPEDQSC